MPFRDEQHLECVLSATNVIRIACGNVVCQVFNCNNNELEDLFKRQSLFHWSNIPRTSSTTQLLLTKYSL